MAKSHLFLATRAKIWTSRRTSDMARFWDQNRGMFRVIYLNQCCYCLCQGSELFSCLSIVAKNTQNSPTLFITLNSEAATGGVL